MGGQTRYLDNLDRRFERAANEAVTRPMPISLTDAELDLEHRRVIVPKSPVNVRAFVRFYEAVIRPDCEAIAWTDRAVKLRVRMQSGAVHDVWVWASAVERR
jgi:hypothetical protein